MKWTVLMALPLVLTGCADPAPRVGGGRVTVSPRALADMGKPNYYAASCDARNFRRCERAAAQICPNGTEVKESRVRSGTIKPGRTAIRDIVFTCRV